MQVHKYFPIVLKLIISFILTYYIYISVPWKDIGEVLLSTSIDLLILSIAIEIVSFVILALRWGVILKDSRLVIMWLEIVKVSYVGIMFNNVLPSSIGGDIVRGAYIIKRGIPMKLSVLSLIADRVIGLLSVLIFSFVFLLIYNDKSPVILDISMVVTFLMAALFLLIFIIKTTSFKSLISTILFKILSSGFYKKTISAINDLYRYSLNKNTVVKVILMTMLAMFLEIMVFYFAAESLNIKYPLYVFVIAVPLMVLITALPISIGGLFVREASGLFILNLLGVEMIHASSIVILFIPIILISSIPGVFFYLKPSASEL